MSMHYNINMGSTIAVSMYDNINMGSSIAVSMYDNINMGSTIAMLMHDNINFEWKRNVCRFCLSFVYICIAVGDPIIK
jgi:RNase P subunit RPR2